MIGGHVTDLISEAGLAMVLDATPWEVASYNSSASIAVRSDRRSGTCSGWHAIHM